MGKIFVGQSALTFVATTGQDLTDATTVKIKYRKPSGTTGEWTALVSDTATGEISYIVNSDGSDLDQYGNWTLWAWVEFSTGRIAEGEAQKIQVYQTGERV